jgi:hypothetical protein
MISDAELVARYNNLRPYIKTAELQQKIDELFNWFTEQRHQDLADIEAEVEKMKVIGDEKWGINEFEEEYNSALDRVIALLKAKQKEGEE